MELSEDMRNLMQADRYASWLTVLGPGEATSFDDVARVAGIEPLEKRWHEVDRPTAEKFLTALLHRSLAYGTELMPASTAAWLASQFVRAPGRYGTRFATNSPDLVGESPFAWTPATDYSMDAGVVALGPHGAGLYWVADED